MVTLLLNVHAVCQHPTSAHKGAICTLSRLFSGNQTAFQNNTAHFARYLRGYSTRSI